MTHNDSHLWRWNLICILILVILPFIIFWPVASGQKIWAVGDFASYQVPMNTVGSEQWRNGVMPLWNPYLNGGTLLAATQNPSMFYPTNILLWLLLPPWATLGYSVLIHLALAGVGTYVFLRSSRLHFFSAFLGGLVFQWSGFGMSHLGHLMFLRALPWIGFSLYSFNLWIDTRKSRYLGGISFSVFCLYLSGYPQIIVYATLLVGTYFLFARRVNSRSLAMAIISAVLGAGVSLIQVFPGIDVFRSGEFLRPGQGVYEAFISFSFHPAYLVTFLFPNARYGTFAEMVGYVGVAPFLLGLLAILIVNSKEELRLKRFFILWAGFSLILAFGRYVPPLAKSTFHIPVYGSFGGINRHLLEFSFSFAVLGAYGVEALIRREWLRDVRVSRIVALAAFIGATAILALFAPFNALTVPLQWSPSEQIIVKPILFILVSISLIIAASFFSQRFCHFAVAGILVVSVIDLASFGIPIYSSSLTSPDFYETAPPTANIIRQKSQGIGPYRIISFEAPGAMPDRELGKELLAANYNETYKIESLIGHEGLQLLRFNAAFSGRIPPWGDVEPKSVNDPHFRKLLDLYGVKFLLIKNSNASYLSPFYNLIATTDRVSIFENSRAYPRLFGMNPDDPEEAMTSSLEARTTDYKGGQITAQIDCRQNQILVHSTNFASGWKVTIDEKPAPLLMVDGKLQGVAVSAGVHQVAFYYDPKGFSRGLIGAAVSICLIAVLCFVARRKGAIPRPIPDR
jgi:hypothetical protein